LERCRLVRPQDHNNTHRRDRLITELQCIRYLVSLERQLLEVGGVGHDSSACSSNIGMVRVVFDW
jgi:hypothetical protein